MKPQLIIQCAAYKCKSHSLNKNALDDNGQPILFHRFPQDESIRNLWIKNLHIHNWKPSKHHHLCSKHFTSICYVKNTTCLRKYAVPTLFEQYPDDEDEDEEDEEGKIKEESDEITSEEEESIAPQKTIVLPSDIGYQYIRHKTCYAQHKKELTQLKSELNATKRRLNRVKEVAKLKRRKIKSLQQQLRRKQAVTTSGKGSATVITVFNGYFTELVK